MKLLYSIGIYIYKFAIYIASFFNKKASQLQKGQNDVFAILKNKIVPNTNYVWFHAASLGEFEQGRPIIEKLKTDFPEVKILLTFFSPSGYEVRKNYSGADIITYLPLDTPVNAKRFVKMVNPSKVIFIKYEFWPNYLLTLKSYNIPTYSISSIFRPSQVFFKPYGSWYRTLLRTFNHIFVQDNNSLELLSTFGIKNVTVAGDTRFDRVVDLANNSAEIKLIETFVKDATQVIVAGSSWPKDEELLIRYLKEHVGVKLILVPHEIHETHIAGIEKLLKSNYVRYTTTTDNQLQSVNCLIVDTIGLLSSIYRYADVAYIGGGFGVGIHNTLEAAVWNVPVIFGPNYKKFREASELISVGGAKTISNYNELEYALNKMFANPKYGEYAGTYVTENVGATTLILKNILPNKH